MEYLEKKIRGEWHVNALKITADGIPFELKIGCSFTNLQAENSFI